MRLKVLGWIGIVWGGFVLFNGGFRAWTAGPVEGAFGAGQLVYGSDMPVVDPRLTLQAVRGFGDAVARLLQIDTPGALIP